ncbi:MAG: TIGR03557 family F420-dependent LLM class oxidoreductase [Actinomycetota bacterium]|nr:TIGR03557 family F420-dependent LLM class oxidoreductase [Actinomycetota bacterium]
MTTFGLKLMSEMHGPSELVRQATVAEERGLEFVSISDHYHPWLPEHDHSPFAWSVLGAIADRTERVGIITGVTCPIIRYSPLIIAQAAATTAVMSGGRFTLGLGAGERLNEHVNGMFPSADVRHEMLGEAIEVIRTSWSGGFVDHRGAHYTVDDARVYDLPDEPIDLVLAVSGNASLDLAKASGAAGIMATDPDGSLVDGWEARGGRRDATWAEVPMAYAADDDTGLRIARERFRFGIPGWKVMSELPNPVNFDAATATVRPEDIAEAIPYGPDPKRYVDAIRSFTDAGFDRLALVPVGDPDETITFFQEQVLPELG